MSYRKRYEKQIIATIVLIVGVVFAFWSFLRNNSNRIFRQNEEYIQELTRQRAVSIDSMIAENLEFIRSTAFLYGRSLSAPKADVAVIRDFEQNTAFDYLRFIDETGDDYTSSGVMANLAEREYFRAGMRGESGITFVESSKVTGEKQIGFYAPVTYTGKIIGVMVGFYGEAYLTKMMEYELFGFEGEGWLCDSEGRVLGSTLEDEPENFLTYLEEKNKCTPEELARIQQAFLEKADISFTYEEGGESATGYLVNLEQEGWMLIRSFPPFASDGILRNANADGIIFIATLLLLFSAYVVFLVINMVLSQKKLREASRNANDISYGMTALFDKFVTVDLTTGEYSYIQGDPDDPALMKKGPYRALVDSILQRVEGEQHREETRQYISGENLREVLTGRDSASIRVNAPLGEGEWFTFNFITLDRKGGHPTRFLLVSQDVTDLHEREVEEQKKLQEALKSAEEASRAKTEFLFNMSHDLRTPMNAIIGYTELAGREGVSETEMRGFIRKIDSSSQHLLALINDILEMSRIESGKLTLEPVPTDLRTIMEDVRELFSAQMKQKDLSYTVDTDRIGHPWVLCDKNRLNRVILNLISNASKFTKEGGSVQVSVAQEARDGETGTYLFRVKDTGIGMSPDFVEKLFMPFERERTSTVSGIQGTGLGLSITKKIVDLMGGTIEVQTEQGKGTEFLVRLSFPLEDAPGDGETAREKGSQELDFGRIRLLLAEDNPVNREIATMILTQSGFQLETAQNGREAVDMLTGREPGYYDAILMDVQMPVLDGYAATKEIRALADQALARIPILAMTANAFREDVQTALDMGMDGHIAKPLEVTKMLETLTEVLSRERQ